MPMKVWVLSSTTYRTISLMNWKLPAAFSDWKSKMLRLSQQTYTAKWVEESNTLFACRCNSCTHKILVLLTSSGLTSHLAAAMCRCTHIAMVTGATNLRPVNCVFKEVSVSFSLIFHLLRSLKPQTNRCDQLMGLRLTITADISLWDHTVCEFYERFKCEDKMSLRWGSLSSTIKLHLRNHSAMKLMEQFSVTFHIRLHLILFTLHYTFLSVGDVL